MQAAASSTPGLRLPSRLRRNASDERLVAALRRGDEQAFEALYDRYHQPLLGFCQHMLGSREEAEDALQHIFVSAHRHLCRDGGPDHLKAWLYTIARNRCVSILRARRETLSIEPEHEPSTEGFVVAGEVERREELEELLGDLARLPDEQRAALVLAELDDLSHEEIATALDVRTDKVKALIFQARETLMGWRQARVESCREIQEQLATLRGSALRRAPIRRHVALCPTCAAFEREVARQRSAMALLVPVLPAVALKHSVLTAALAGSHEAAGAGAAGAVAAAGAAGTSAGAGAGLVGAGASGLTVKALAATALAIAAAGGGAVAVRKLDPPRPLQAPPAATGSAAAGAIRPAGAAPGTEPHPGSAAAAHRQATPSHPVHPAHPATPRGASASAPGHLKSHRRPRHVAKRHGRPGATVHGRAHNAVPHSRGTASHGAGRVAPLKRPAPATSQRSSAVKAPTVAVPAPAKAPAVKAPVVNVPAAPRAVAPPKVKPDATAPAASVAPKGPAVRGPKG
jgi:RNA polymerase sigma factor (sigma-70 family)